MKAPALNYCEQIAKFEYQRFKKSVGYWLAPLGLVFLAAFSLIDSWEIPPANMAVKLGDTLVPFLFLIAGYITLTGASREERAGFQDVYLTLPIHNAELYWGKLRGAICSMTVTLGVAAALTAISTIVQQPLNAAAWLVIAFMTVEMAAAIFSGMATAMFVTAVISTLRARYLLILFWLIGLILLSGLAIAYDLYALQGQSLLLAASYPYQFSTLTGFNPFEVAITQHLVVQIGQALLLLAAGAMLFHSRREPQQRSSYSLLLTTLILWLGASSFQAIYWQQKTSALYEVGHYRFEAGHNSARADWISLSGKFLLPDHGTALGRVDEYDLKVSLAGKSQGIAVNAVVKYSPTAQTSPDKIIFTLDRKLQVHTVTQGACAAPNSATSTWQPVSFVRKGDFLAITPLAEPIETSQVCLSISYSGKPVGIFRNGSKYEQIEYTGNSGTFLPANAGWYPLPGGWELGWITVLVSNSQYAAIPWNSQFRVTIDAPAGMQVVSNLPKSGSAENTFAGQADGTSLFVAPYAIYNTTGLKVYAAAASLQHAAALGDAYKEITDFYSSLLERDLPELRIATLPDLIARRFNQYMISPLGNRVELVNTVLGHTAGWSENRLAIAVRDARKYLSGHGSAQLPDLQAAILQRLWGGIFPHRSYQKNPILNGAGAYMSMLWEEHAAAENGAGRYEQRLAQYLSALAAAEPMSDTWQICAVIQTLHAKRQAAGATSVGRTLAKLMDLAALGDVSWVDWETVAH